MSSNIEQLRVNLAKLAKTRKTRSASFSYKLPTDWGPAKIINPVSGLPFNDDSAWQLIAELLENKSYPVERVILEKPPGQEALEILYRLPDKTMIYIKVHLGAGGRVFGRSFHISNKH